MTEIISSFSAQTPGIAALLTIVLVFLRFIRSSERSRLQTLKNIGDGCHAVQEKAIKSIDRNTEMMGRCSVIMERMERRLDKNNNAG